MYMHPIASTSIDRLQYLHVDIFWYPAVADIHIPVPNFSPVVLSRLLAASVISLAALLFLFCHANKIRGSEIHRVCYSRGGVFWGHRAGGTGKPVASFQLPHQEELH